MISCYESCLENVRDYKIKKHSVVFQLEYMNTVPYYPNNDAAVVA